MTLPLDLRGTVLALAAAQPVIDGATGGQKTYRSQPDWRISIAVAAPDVSAQLDIKVASDSAPDIAPLKEVVIEGLVATEWENSVGNHGVSYRAASVRMAASRNIRGGGEA
ncbi:hypothetical protein [Ferrimicrobium sp.]|uniref:hypothetical protein n=1 Tax=Ferrimicrobium sp. TaxID=2926050 RepID=UPI0026186A19|nr:hypothetical protein [Ferrimicrobium sp.]